jgi:hydrogenase expression/formation protein HypE
MKQDRILLAHGSGGTMMRRLISDVFLEAFDNEALARLDDAATLALPPGRLSFSTDTYVVQPLFFAGGDIGRLAACGTVNDVSMTGAVPAALSCGFVLEEGFPLADLRRILESMAAAAAEANVPIVTGDTKVVEKGGCDGVFINTSGVGVIPDSLDIHGANARPADVVLLSGSIGDHGVAVMSEREGLAFSTSVQSDCAPLNAMIAGMVAAAGPWLHALRDPTRGGIASALNEFAEASGVAIEIDEGDIPVKAQVRGACEMLGYDVLQVANEGKLLAVVAPEGAQAALEAMRQSPYGTEAAAIGRVLGEGAPGKGKVFLNTSLGSRRVVDMLVGEQLPRIC